MTGSSVISLTIGVLSALLAETVSLPLCAQEKFGPSNEICAGVNIHFTTGHEKDLDMIAAAGFKFIRMDFVWHNIETVRGIYNWTDYEELTKNLSKRGLRAIYILDYSNGLYEPVVESKDPITGEVQKGVAAPGRPESVAAFAKWAAAAAGHFSENNIIWEIWNEPNITFWKPAPDVKQYINLALTTCKAVRAVAPNSLLMGPATSQIPFPFIETFLASGVLEYLDAVSVHPYRDYSKPPETAAEDYKILEELIGRYSPARRTGIPVISSEWGYASATKGLTVETQAAYIVRMQLANLLNGVPVSIWYDWKNDGDDPGNFEHNCGTVTSGLKPKPAYIAIQTMNRELKDFTLAGRLPLESENDYALIFKNRKGSCKLCAWTTKEPHSAVIDKIIPEVENSVVSGWNGDELKPQSSAGRLVLSLDGMPQYITLPDTFRMSPD